VSLPIIFLTFAIITAWYKLFYLPQKDVEYFLSKGASLLNLETSPFDELYGVKKAIQKDPDLKVLVGKVPGKAFLTLFDADLIKELVTNHSLYSKLNKTSELNKMIASQSVFHAEGTVWKMHRVVLSEAFQYSFFNDMIPVIAKTTDEILSISSPKKQTIQLPDTTEQIANEAVTNIFFGLSASGVDFNGLTASQEMSRLVHKFMYYHMSKLRFFPGMWALNFFSDYRETKRRMNNVKKILKKKIDDRLQELANDKSGVSEKTKNSDVLEILLRHRRKCKDPSETLSDEEIFHNFFLFNIAGKDTTSGLISMSLYYCHKYPEWGQKLIQEVEETIKNIDDINLDLITGMTFMQAFLAEVLRIHPTGVRLLPRIVNKDHNLGKFFLKKGTIISVNLLANNYNPKFFNEPEKFDPSRWLKDDTRKEGWKNNPFAYLPFSGGPRGCLGKHMALIETKVVLCMILKHYNLHIDPDYKLKLAYIGVAYLPVDMPLTLIPK
jgi:cytochrome P450